MIKIILFTIAIFIVTGCGIYERTDTRVECINNKVLLTVWKADMVSLHENIKYDYNLQICKKHQTGMICKNIPD